MVGMTPDPYLALYSTITGGDGSNAAVLEDISQQLEQVVGQLSSWADALQRACMVPPAVQPEAAAAAAAANSSQAAPGVVHTGSVPTAVAAPSAAAPGAASGGQAQVSGAETQLLRADLPARMCDLQPTAVPAAAGAAAVSQAAVADPTASAASERTAQGPTAAAAAALRVESQGPRQPRPQQQQHGGHSDRQPAGHQEPAAPAAPCRQHDQLHRVQLWALVLAQALHDCAASLDAAMGLFGGLTAGSRTFPTSHELFLAGLVQQRRAAEMATQASKLQAAAEQLQQLLSPQGLLPGGSHDTSVWAAMCDALGKGSAQVAAANGQLLQALCWWLGWEGAPGECPLAQPSFDTQAWFDTLHQRHSQQGRRVAPFAVQLAAQDKAPLQALVSQLAALLKEARKQVPTAAGVDLADGRRQLFAAEEEVGQLLQLRAVPLLGVPPEDVPASAAAAPLQAQGVAPPGADPQQEQEQAQATGQLWELVLGEAYQELATSVEALVSLQLDHLGSSDLLQPDHRSMYLVWLQHLGAVEVTLRRVRRLAAAVQQQQRQQEQERWQQQQQQGQQYESTAAALILGAQQPLAGTGAQLLTLTQKLLDSLQLRLLWAYPADQHPLMAAAPGDEAVESFFAGRAAQQAQQAPGEAAQAAATAGDLRFSLMRGLQLLKGSRAAWHRRCTLLADSLGAQAAQVDCTAAKKVLYAATLQELEAWPLHCRSVPMLPQAAGNLGHTRAAETVGSVGRTAAADAPGAGSSSPDKMGRRNRLSGVADTAPIVPKDTPEVQHVGARRGADGKRGVSAAVAVGLDGHTPSTACMPQGAANSAAPGPAAAADGVGQPVANTPGSGSTSMAGKPGRPSKPVPTPAALAAAAAAAAAGVGRKRPPTPTRGVPAKRHSGGSAPAQSAGGPAGTASTPNARGRAGKGPPAAAAAAAAGAAAAPQHSRGLWNVDSGTGNGAGPSKRPSSRNSSPTAAKRRAGGVLRGADADAATAAGLAQQPPSGVSGDEVACVSNPIMQQLMQATSRAAVKQSPTAKRGSRAASKSSKAAAGGGGVGAQAGLSAAGSGKASRTQKPVPAAAPSAAGAPQRNGSGGAASSSDGGAPTSGGEEGGQGAPAAHADVIILGPPDPPHVPTAATEATAAAGPGGAAPAGRTGDQAAAAGGTVSAGPGAAPASPSSEEQEEQLPALLERKLPKAVAEAEMQRCAAVAREQALKDREAQRRAREAEALKRQRAQARLQELHAEAQKRAAAEAAREVIRTQVRHELDDKLGRAVRMLDLRAVLRALGVSVGKSRSKAALAQAYKAARVQYHPDKWTRAEVRQQVYAEEVSKILNSRDLQDTL